MPQAPVVVVYQLSRFLIFSAQHCCEARSEQAALCLQEPAQRAAFEAAKKAEEESTGDAATDRQAPLHNRLIAIWVPRDAALCMLAGNGTFCHFSAVADM